MTADRKLVSCLLLALIAALTPCAAAAEKSQRGTASDGDSPKVASAKKETSDSAAENVTFILKGRKQTVRGRTVVEAADGGILFEGVDGTLWSIERNELQAR